MSTEISLRKITHDAVMPSYANFGDAGADISSNEDIVVPSGQWRLVSTGIGVNHIPENLQIEVRSRSGLAAKNGVFVLNSPGTIDSGYRGEIKVILANMSSEEFFVAKGMRIAQLVVMPFVKAEFTEKSEETASDRGRSGFGSTGV